MTHENFLKYIYIYIYSYIHMNVYDTIVTHSIMENYQKKNSGKRYYKNHLSVQNKIMSVEKNMIEV